MTTPLTGDRRLRLTPRAIALGFCGGVTLLVFLSLLAATLAHEFRLLQRSSVGPPYPMTVYKLMPAPGTSPVPGAAGAAGADFSQVYTSALALRHGESAYFPTHSEFADRFGRRPGFPPLTNWAYVPLSFLSYYHALLVHTAASLLILFGASAVVLWKARLRRHIVPVLLVQCSLYFFTPIGVTHLERGQFEMLVAAAIALCVACVFIEQRAIGLAALSGILGALKWTSAPFLGCFSVAGFLLGSRRRRWSFFLIPVVMVFATAVFWRDMIECWSSIRNFEIEARPRGLTLQHFLPYWTARFLPSLITLAVIGTARVRARSESERDQLLFAISVPFGLALMILSICYPTISFEYHAVSALGMIPAVVMWTERDSGVSNWVKLATCTAFGLFLCVAFRTVIFAGQLDAIAMTRVYAWFGASFLVLCAGLIAAPTRQRMRPRTEPFTYSEVDVPESVLEARSASRAE